MSLTNECLKRLTESLEREQLLSRGDKLLLAVSAGADSTAMLYLFSRLRHSLNFSLLAVHINHQLRGEASDQDAEQIKKTCMQLNVPLIIRKISLGDARDLENRAREARFSIFDQILDSYRFDRVLLAHHKWDQAETVLLNLMRGSGLSGMGGIKATQGKVLHPMLGFTPQELRDLLIEAGIDWREDASNQDLHFTRNRVRAELIPHLEEIYNPRIREKLTELSAILQDADQYVCQKALKRYKKLCLDVSPQRIILNLPGLLKAPEIEHFYILREAFSLLAGGPQDFFLANLKEIQRVYHAQGSKYVSLSHGIYVVKRYQELVFTNCLEDVQPPANEALEIEPDRLRAVHMNYRFRFKYLKVLPKDYKKYDGQKVIIDADKIKGRFVIRSRQAGDRFIPFGMKGFKKLKDFFIDEKVAKYDRDSVPIFEDGEKIFWICGHRIDERVRCTAESTRFLMIEAVSLSKKPNRAANRIKRGNDEFDEL